MRNASIERNTSETNISLSLVFEGTGGREIDTGIGFLDHMLDLFSAHSGFDLNVLCKGDTQVDGHHTAEDVGICLGQALKEALKDKKGIRRYASLALPMDEALVLCAVDISGRGMLQYHLPMAVEKIGTFDVQLLEEFFQAFAVHAGITLHIRLLDGRNAHHIAEAAFKATARVLKDAVQIVSDTVPSTKGVL